MVPGETPCTFGIYYRSVIGTGEASLVMDQAEKLRGLDLISKKYAGYAPAEYPRQHSQKRRSSRL